jgi:hypothetical protein
MVVKLYFNGFCENVTESCMAFVFECIFSTSTLQEKKGSASWMSEWVSEWLSKNSQSLRFTQNFCRMASTQDKIWIGYFRNASLEHYCFISLVNRVGSETFECLVSEVLIAMSTPITVFCIVASSSVDW